MRGQTFHLPHRHLLIRFVVEIERSPASRLVAHHSLEHDRSPIFRSLDALKHTPRVNRIAHDGRRLSRSATHRRQQRHFVVRFQNSLRPPIFLIHSHRQRSHPFPHLRTISESLPHPIPPHPP